MNDIKDNDKNQIKELWAYAFDEQEPFLSEYFDGFWEYDNAVFLKDEDIVAASLQMVPYKLWVRNRYFDASYIVGVSVGPQFRGKKYSHKLMKNALIEQKERKEAISLLIPFSYEFYKKMGYSLCYNLNVYETKLDNIKTSKISCDFKRMTPDDFCELNKIYEKFCCGKNGYNLRKEKDWEYIFFEHSLFNGFVYGAYKNDELCGYVSYVKEYGKIFVREIVYSDYESLNSLLGIVTSHFSGSETAVIRTSEDDFLEWFLKEPKGVKKVAPMAMARITDVCAVLSCVDIGNVKINVCDEFIPENSGVYAKTQEGISKVENEDFDAEMSISALTKLVMGYMSASELEFFGEIKASKEIIEKLEKIFPKTTNYINHIMEA